MHGQQNTHTHTHKKTVQCFLFVMLRVRISFWEFFLTDICLGFTRSLQNNLKCCPSSENPLCGHQNVDFPQTTFFCVAIYWDELKLLVMESAWPAVLSIRHEHWPWDLFVCPHVHASPNLFCHISEI